MPKGVYDHVADQRRVVGRCANCGKRVQSNGTRMRQRKYCPPCLKIRQKAQKAAWMVKRKHIKQDGPGTWSDSAYLTVGSSNSRQIADAALEQGGVKRHCMCGQWYVMDRFDSPCPHCADALVPLPGGPYVDL